VRAFIEMVVAMGRVESLPAIVEAFQGLVDEAQQRLRVVVRAAHPLPGALLQRLRATLESREAKTIELTTEVTPALLGGLQVQLGHRLIDGSVQRQVDELRQQLKSIRLS
jgi:F-type H+-transporting ATPase subunit delta